MISREDSLVVFLGMLKRSLLVSNSTFCLCFGEDISNETNSV